MVEPLADLGVFQQRIALVKGHPVCGIGPYLMPGQVLQ
jgi:hypothetical protein